MAGDDEEATPAGWYRQPDAPDILRWWDGDDWTDDTMPAPSERRSAGGARREARAEPGGAGAEQGGSSAAATPAADTAAAGRPRRTRRDAMAEAEAEARASATVEAPRAERSEPGIDPPRAAATPVRSKGPVAEGPPIEIERDDRPAPGPRPGARKAPAPDDDRPRGTAGDTVARSADRRPPPPSDDGPGYRRPPTEGGPTGGQAPGPDRSGAAALRTAGNRPSGSARRQDPRPRPEGRLRADTGTGSGGSGDGDHGAPHRGRRLAQPPSPATAAALLRVLGRAAIIAAAVALGWLAFTRLADAGGDADTLDAELREVVVDPDAAPVDQVVLQLVDLPRGWSVQASDPSSDDVCDGRIPRSVIEPTALASAAFTRDDGSGLIGNVVMDFGDEQTARDFMSLTATVIDSCREYSADGSTVHLTPMSFPRFGDETFVAEASGESPGGDLHGAIVYVRDGHRVASVITITFGDGDVNTALIEHLTQLVDRRMRSSAGSGGTTPADSSGDAPGLPGE